MSLRTWAAIVAAFTASLFVTVDRASAGTIATMDRGGWYYDMTDQPYQDGRLGYAIEAARMYWGQLPAGFRVLTLVATPTAPMDQRGDMAIGMQRPVDIDDHGAIWVNAAYYGERVDGKRIQNRANLCTTVVHEARHAMDPRPDLDPHRVIPEDPEHVMQGFTPRVCLRLTPQDVLRRQRMRCKRHPRKHRTKCPAQTTKKDR